MNHLVFVMSLLSTVDDVTYTGVIVTVRKKTCGARAGH